MRRFLLVDNVRDAPPSSRPPRPSARTPRIGRAPFAKPLVLTSGDGAFARLAAADVMKAGRPARCLQGGTAAWRAADQPLVAGEERMACPANDVWYSPHDAQQDQRAAMQAYLRWEIALMDQLEREGGAPFRVFR